MRKAGIILTLSIAMVLSCIPQEEASRIHVSSSEGKTLLKRFVLPLEGGVFTLNAKSVCGLDIFYEEASGDENGWFKLLDVQETRAGEYTVKCSSAPRGNTLDLRQGTLCFSAPSASIGTFLDVRQGYERIWREDFSKQADGVLILAPGESWESSRIAGISSIKRAYVAFEARVEPSSGTDAFISEPLHIAVTRGSSFPEIARDVYQIDANRASAFDNSTFYKLEIYHAGLVFSSETTLVLSVPKSAKASVIIDNLSVYEIPASGDDIDAISDDDEYDEE